jgi:hypothetical protein
MSSLTQFFLTGALVLPAMVAALYTGPSAGIMGFCLSAMSLAAALLCKVMHDENEAESFDTWKERERRAEHYSLFGRDDDEH